MKICSSKILKLFYIFVVILLFYFINTTKKHKYELFNSSWQTLQANSTKLQIYSAFSITHGEIRIIGKAKYQGQGQDSDLGHAKIYCEIEDQGKFDITSGLIVKLSSEYHNYPGNIRITCSTKYHHANHVRLIIYQDHNKEVVSKSIRIEHNKRPSSTETVVCVRPLYGPYASIKNILEFIAYYRTQRVNRLVLYYSSLAEEVIRQLETMKEFIELVHWIDEKEQHNSLVNQMSMIDHCMHRYIDKVIIFVDLDEFIVSYNTKTLMEFIQNQYNSDKNLAAISVRNVFFCHEFNKNEQADQYPRILHHFRRQKHISMNGKRSKIIVMRPRLVDVIGVHDVQQLSGSHQDAFIKIANTSRMVMYHYRRCNDIDYIKIGSKWISTLEDEVIEDEFMLNFKNTINKFLIVFLKFGLTNN